MEPLKGTPMDPCKSTPGFIPSAEVIPTPMLRSPASSWLFSSEARGAALFNLRTREPDAVPKGSMYPYSRYLGLTVPI